MKRSIYTNYDELPLFLNAEFVSKVLGISISSAYELMREDGFPSLRVGSRIIVPKEMPPSRWIPTPMSQPICRRQPLASWAASWRTSSERS